MEEPILELIESITVLNHQALNLNDPKEPYLDQSILRANVDLFIIDDEKHLSGLL
jgi:hypothetical protein